MKKRAYNLPWAEAMQENKKLTAELKALQAELTRLKGLEEAVRDFLGNGVVLNKDATAFKTVFSYYIDQLQQALKGGEAGR